MKRLLSHLATLCLAIITILSSCNGPSADTDQIDQRANEYISGYTTGTMDRNQELIIKFAKPAIETDKVGSVADGGIFSISPSINGSAEWDDISTLIFTPSEELKWDSEYKVSIDLKALFGDDVSIKKFDFNVVTAAKNFSIELLGLSLSENSDSEYFIEGYISTSGEFETEEAESIISADQGGKQLSLEWVHDDVANGHTFFIRGIERKEDASTVDVNWNGKSIGVDSKGSESLDVPSMSEFKITSWRVVNSPSQYLAIEFSDRISPDIELRGMVQIDGRSAASITRTENILNVFTGARLTGNRTIVVDGSLSNSFNFKLGDDVEFSANFGGVKPGVRLRGSGVIIPQTEGLIFPFEAANLKAVDLRITKIFTNNIHYFLQENNLDGSYELAYFGRLIKAVKIDLVSDNNLIEYSNWNSFSVDLAKYIDVEKGAIYRVEVGFRKSYSEYPCEDDSDVDMYYYPVEEEGKSSRSTYNEVYWDRYYDWQKRDEPCSQAYFSPDKFVVRNVLGSNFGIIAKKDAAGKMNVIVTDLLTASPVSDAVVDAFDFQNQQLASVRTDNDGFAYFSPERSPFLLIASKNNDVGYLKTSDGNSLSMSNFDVSGQSSVSGTKGFIYGERGVWRPGDSVYVAFILEDKQQWLPDGHPIIFELYDTRGQLVKRSSTSKSDRVIYPFWFKTGDSDPTGNWNAKVKVGGTEFNKRIRIETVKPNRLKINFEFDEDVLTGNSIYKGSLNAKWLHGTPASGMKARITATFAETGTRFADYPDYVFDAPFGTPYIPEKDVFESNLDNDGNARVNFNFKPNDDVNEMLRATFITRVFESGGDFSINRITKAISPFKTYVGFSIPWSNTRYRRLNTDEDHEFEVVTVNKDGEPVNGSGISVKVFKLNWRYWWSRSGENLANYSGRTYHKPVMTSTLNTREGKGNFKLKIPKGGWGRYLILVDLPDGNVAGKVVYFDWPWGRKQSAGGADILNVSTERESYNVGEEIIVSFPAGVSSSGLLTIENGSAVLRQEWIENIEENTTWTFTATKDMAPNVYVHVSLINPHGETANDLPIRMYGLAPVSIEDPGSHLKPLISMPDRLRPEKEFEVEVSEESGRMMEYTLAIVDEGLLDLTGFRTPDPWPVFYRKEALGVKTWDMYRFVLGAYGGELEKMFAIGGDEAGVDNSKNERKRFEPVVEVLGPFVLEKGKTDKHSITLPQYVGSVRTMVVAADGYAYGNTEKTVPVNNPVMVLGTLPRVLAPGEKIKLPVAVFVMDEGIKSVNVELQTNDMLIAEGELSRVLKVDKPGEYDMEFDFVVSDRTGQAAVDIIASAGKEEGRHEIFIEVRNPNPPETRGEIKKLEPGENLDLNMDAFGSMGSNSGTVEVSGIMPLNLEKRLGYLMRYPHGCIEQTTSAVFPQIYLKDLADLNDEQRKQISNTIGVAIDKMRRFQLSNGAMSFWPGSSYESEWGSIYAAHFLVEAEKAGYGVPSTMKNRLLNWIKTYTNKYRFTSVRRYSHISQAYGLYVLSLAGEPASGTMNRLRERGQDLEFLARWYLAGAYAMAGRTDAANSLIDLRELTPQKYYYETYGSITRDKAVVLNILALLERDEEAFAVARDLSGQLSSGSWMNTQTTAWCLIALSEFFGDQDIDEPVAYQIDIDGDKKNIRSDKLVNEYPVDNDKTGGAKVSVTNSGDKAIFVSAAWTGTPLEYNKVVESRGIEIDLKYKTKEGREINPASIKQGEDFKVEVSIKNKMAINAKDLALIQIFPSGWEIMNTRLFEGAANEVNSFMDYQDIRDDRVYTYFNLGAGKTSRFELSLTAAYEGQYTLPATICEGMYDNSFFAKTVGQEVSVVK